MVKTTKGKQTKRGTATTTTKRRLVFNDKNDGDVKKTRAKAVAIDLTDDTSDQIPSDAKNTSINTKSRTVVTPVKKRNFFGRFKSESSVASTPKEYKNAVAVVTPPDESAAQEPIRKKKQKLNNQKEDDYEKDSDHYIPTYIHKNLSYARKGETRNLSEQTKKVFALVQKYFQIPNNFENDRSFGPLSGMCYEERVIGAYSNSLLKPKLPEYAKIEICSNCAVEGHVRDDCPLLI